MARKTDAAVKPRRLDRRNPFNWGTLRYGYFQALLRGKGTTTVDEMVAEAMKVRQAVGIVDDERSVRKDLADHKYEWKRDARGTSYKLHVRINADGSLTCVAVDGVPWARFLEGKVR